MAWGGLIFSAGSVRSASDLAHNYQMPSLGSAEFVRDRISELFPQHQHEIEMSKIADKNCWIELSYDSCSMVSSIGVRTNGNAWALGAVLDVSHNLGAKLYDNQNGDFVNSIEDSTMDDYQRWRDSFENAG